MVILTALLLTATALLAIPASAAPQDGPVKAEGYVEGGSDEALIVCKWELPDARPYQGGMQYGSTLGRYEDGAGYPCRVDDGEFFPYYEQEHTVLAVRAPAHDLYDSEIPALPIELWSAVAYDGGLPNISGVHWRIFHPDGSLKDQVHGTRVTPAQADSLGVRWDGSQYQIIGGMWEAASDGTRQLEEAAVEDGTNGLVALSHQGRVALYRSSFPLHKDQPCGRYTVENHVLVDGSRTWITNYIWVMCFIDLQLDFEFINWGRLTPGDKKILNGNLEWGDYDPDQSFGSRNMTVGNGGSGEMVVGVRFAPLVEQNEAGPKLIRRFDAAFSAIGPSNLQVIDPIYAGEEPGELGEWAWFNHDYDRTLCANETGKLDLSVLPPRDIPNGAYQGHMVIYGMGGYGNGDSVVTTTTDTPPNDEYICNNPRGDWDGGNQRPD